MKAEFVKEHFNGVAKWKLWRLSHKCASSNGVVFEYIVTSAAHTSDHGDETYVFASDSDGEKLSYLELPGSFVGGLDHDKALQVFLGEFDDKEPFEGFLVGWWE